MHLFSWCFVSNFSVFFFLYKLCIKYLHNKVIHLKKNILYVIFKGIFGYILEYLNLGGWVLVVPNESVYVILSPRQT